MAKRSLERTATGVPGIDTILCGGLPKGQMYLIDGAPGVGKTTLALQFLREGARRGERCLYVTLSETKSELETVAESHDWTLDGIDVVELSQVESHYSVKSQNTLFQPAEVELTSLSNLLVGEFDRIAPVRMVLDSLSEVRLMAQNPLRYRRQILAFKQHFALKGCTVLMLDDRSALGQDVQVQSIVHGLITLETVPLKFGINRRFMNVPKMRGSMFREGNHDYVIKQGGLTVFPRLLAAEQVVDFKKESFTSGNAQLDKLLGGGLDAGTGTLFMGPAGSGKSTVASMFAANAAHAGNHVLYFAFDEVPNILINRAQEIGLDFAGAMRSGNLEIRQIDPAEVAPGELADEIHKAIDTGTRMVVLDSLNGYVNAMPQEEFLHLHLHELLTYLNQKGVVTIMILAQHGLLGPMGAPVDVSYLADTVMLTRYFEARGAVKKALSVIKKRSGAHEDTIRELTMSARGVVIGEPLVHFEGVMTGVPRFLGGQPAAAMKAVVVTPNESDRFLSSGFLTDEGIEVEAVAGMADLGPRVGTGVGCIVLVEEALAERDLALFHQALAAQPPWSDMPLIIIAAQGSSLAHLIESVFPISGNVTFLQRPLHPVSLVSAVRAALRARARQYQVRDLLAGREKALKQRDEFLAMLAHELRNPLAPIRNAVYLLGTLDNDDPVFVKCRAMIDKQARHITRLVDDLLDVSRLELGKVDLRLQRVDLNEAVTSAVEACLPMTNEHRHAVTVKTASRPLVVRADPVRIEQAIGNLIVNAAKFTPAGGSITVEVAADGGHGVVTVTDTGVGIRPEMLEFIFDLFAQSEVTLARTAGGLGIGLTLVKRLVELHGGEVKASSAGPGKGATFAARLPLASGVDAREEARRVAAAPVSRRVLVAEDGEDTRESLGILLAAWNHHVVFAHDGPDAVRVAREAHPDIALIDIGLPGFDGYAVAREIRGEGTAWARTVRLVALTGYGQASDRARAIEAGFDVHMLKPVDPAELKVVISR